MSTPEQPSTPPLTRKQLRELRNTGATPVVPAGGTPAPAPDDAAHGGPEPSDAPAVEPAPAPPAPLPRAAEPVQMHTAPVPDASVDLGESPLTRRQARQQERIRTASVPVISPDLGAVAAAGQTITPSAPVALIDSSPWPFEDEPVAATPAAGVGQVAQPVVETAHTEAPAVAHEPSSERAVLNPMFGAGLLAGEAAANRPASSFEQLLTRDLDTTGSVAASSALIMSHASAAPLVGPIGGTGEVLVTGTFALPEGLGSTGHIRGTADGREVDAVLVDGELPAHSSPTPIAASAAVSTIKSSEDIIQPPAPDKGGRLMLTLAITAGVLALALVGVLVYALVTGVIS